MAQRYATAAEVTGPNGVAPALSVLDSALVATWMTIAQSFVGVTQWGDRASIGHALISAHLLSLTPEAVAAGVGAISVDGYLTSEADGGASRSFAVPNPTAEDTAFLSTSYGKLWVELRRLVASSRVGILARGTISAGFWPYAWGRAVWSR